MSRGTRLAVGIAAAGFLAAAIWLLVRDPASTPLPGGPPPVPESGRSPEVAAPPESRNAPSGEVPKGGDPADLPGDGAAVEGIAVTFRLELAGAAKPLGQVQFDWSPGELRCSDARRALGSDGTVATRLPGPGRYHVFDVWADGEQFPEAETTVEIAAGGDVALRIGEVRPLVLEVRDSVTKSPVRDARAWLDVGQDDASDAEAHVVPDPKLLSGGPLVADWEGCITLPPARGSVRVAVWAPGKAWTRARVPVQLGRVPVELVPGGAVRLRIENWKALEEARVFTGAVEGAPKSVVPVPAPEPADPPAVPSAAAALEGGAEGDAAAPPVEESNWDRIEEPVPAPGEDGTILLEGLPCGPRRFDVRRGDAWSRGNLYGTASCVIVEGATVDVAIRTTPAISGPRIPLAGDLTVPEEWGPLLDENELPTIEVTGLEKTNATVDLYLTPEDPANGRTLRFAGDPVPPGRYRILVQRFGWAADFDVAEGAPRPHWTLPPPATFRLKILDSESLKPVDGASFNATGDGGGTSWNPRVTRHGEEGEYVLLLPPDAWAIDCNASGYEESTVRVEARAPTEVWKTVSLRPGARVEILVRFEGKPWTEVVEFEISRDFEKSGGFELAREEKGDESEGLMSGMSTSTGGGSTTFSGLGPGHWTVSIGELAGFEPVTPRTLNLRRGEKVEVVFDLERKK